uniref:Uncharacterized protein n=1 Tax=Chromera velia CCMP2878 TaxID=1169474 RepID=A0A0G4G557_9ALVE|eukprot:Cvel_20327.t1-p1 / transcript=Cvel_20327.t1 / gene=Cvel_20327 / organism=Chromera_velia_CCMP2878 / gene_product=hypothetical protein / transcript_product=hypothetical protein / location=Cvel_scaffold1816:336-1481(-) / protein_length=382 / sequence_SO=supercontig / SO=protein_coding / is_pseudo=false
MFLRALLLALCVVGARGVSEGCATPSCTISPILICESLYAGRQSLSSPCDGTTPCEETYSKIREDKATWTHANELLTQQGIDDKERCAHLEKPGSSSGSSFCASSFMSGFHNKYKRCTDCQKVFADMQPAEKYSACDPVACGENFEICLKIQKAILDSPSGTKQGECPKFVETLRSDKDAVQGLFIKTDASALGNRCESIKAQFQKYAKRVSDWDRLLGLETEEQMKGRNEALWGVEDDSIAAIANKLQSGLEGLFTSPSYLNPLKKTNPTYAEKFEMLPPLLLATDASYRLHSSEDLRGIVAATHTAELWNAVREQARSMVSSAQALVDACKQLEGPTTAPSDGFAPSVAKFTAMRKGMDALKGAMKSYEEPEDNLQNDRG